MTKDKIYKHCISLIENQITTAENAMLAAKEAGNNETKSSVGDKYETGRAMAQIEYEKNKVQLIRAKQTMVTLNQIKIEGNSESIDVGSLFYTDKGKFFISIGLGKIKFEGQDYFVFSKEAPIFKPFFRKKIGEFVQFRNKTYTITAIF